jgi:hypothetical protein
MLYAEVSVPAIRRARRAPAEAIYRENIMSALARRHAASTSIVRTKAPQPRIHPLAHALALVLLAGNASAATFNAGNQNQLIQAINNANANAGEDRIRLTSDVVLSAALPTITDALILDGTGDQRKIKRNDSGSNACSPTATNAFRLIDATADLTLRDLKLTGGCNLVDQGGAVRVQGAALRVERCKISGNQTFVENPTYAYGQGIGGGIAVLSGGAKLVDSTVSDNATHGNLAFGGGVAASISDLELKRSTISGNSVTGNVNVGGGIYATGDISGGVPRTVTIRNSSVSGNRIEGNVARGGGLYLVTETTTITDSLIDGNQVIGGYDGRAGGLNIANISTPFADVSIDRTTISANTVVSEGEGAAGMFIAGPYHFTLNASSVIGNSTTNTVFCRGGGIDLYNVAAIVTDSTISGNTIDSPFGRGGGIFIYNESDSFPASLSVYNSTIADNVINGDYSRGGGVRFQSWGNYDGAHDSIPPAGLFESTIISGNVATEGSAIQIRDSAVVANNSLIEGTVETNPTQAGTFTPDAVTIALFGQDPLLRPLADNGGPTLTHALPCGSPAINFGSNVTGLRFDQRDHGFPRRRGHNVDIGAVETDCSH